MIRAVSRTMWSSHEIHVLYALFSQASGVSFSWTITGEIYPQNGMWSSQAIGLLSPDRPTGWAVLRPGATRTVEHHPKDFDDNLIQQFDEITLISRFSGTFIVAGLLMLGCELTPSSVQFVEQACLPPNHSLTRGEWPRLRSRGGMFALWSSSQPQLSGTGAAQGWEETSWPFSQNFLTVTYHAAREG